MTVKLYVSRDYSLYVVTGSKVEYWSELEGNWRQSVVLAREILSNLVHEFKFIGEL